MSSPGTSRGQLGWKRYFNEEHFNEERTFDTNYAPCVRICFQAANYFHD
jgi:hypothetical protein